MRAADRGVAAAAKAASDHDPITTPADLMPADGSLTLADVAARTDTLAVAGAAAAIGPGGIRWPR